MLCRADKELKLVDKAAAEFANKELAPNREENDLYPFGPFWESTVNKAFELGLFHTTLPVELDGMGHGLAGLSIILKNICAQDASLGGMLFTNAMAQEIMLEAKARELLQEKITKQEDPYKFVVAFPAFNNPSEIRHLASVTKRKDKYTLSGQVQYVVLGGLSSYALIPGAKDGQDDFSFFLVDLGHKKVSRSEPIFSLGLHACPAVDISLTRFRESWWEKKARERNYLTRLRTECVWPRQPWQRELWKAPLPKPWPMPRKETREARKSPNGLKCRCSWLAWVSK